MSREKIIQAYKENKCTVDFYPYSIDIEITTFCNFECRMCPHSILKNTVAKHMDLRILKALEPWIKHVKKVSLQGDGEPFMNPDIGEIVEFFEKRGVRLSTTTNLSIFDEEKARLIEGFDTITISCDGCEREIYEDIRQNGSFDLFCKNLKLFMSLVKKPNIIVNCVMMRQNIAYAEKMVDFVNQYGIKNLIFSNILTDTDLKNTDDSIELFGGYAYGCIKAAKKKAEHLGVNLIVGWDIENCKKESSHSMTYYRRDRQNDYNDEEISRFTERYQNTRTIESDIKYPAGKYHCEGICSNIYEKTYIDADGNVTLCCFGKTNPVGNILTEDFEQIWNGKIYSCCRNDFFNGKLPDFCIGCKYALSVFNGLKQPYDFRIIDVDADFIKDETFWENRKASD